MNFLQKIRKFLLGDQEFGASGGTAALLSHAEKCELEVRLRTQLLAYHDEHGPSSLLQPGVFVVVDVSGPRVQQGRPANSGCLAAIETCSLPSAISLLAMGQANIVVPRDIVKFFGTEAASAVAAAINRIAANGATPS